MNTWLTTVLLLTGFCDGARILVFQPTNARSHSLVMEPLFEALAARGHHLTVLTSYPHKPPLPNLREIDVSHKLMKITSNFTLSMIRDIMPNPFESSLSMAHIELSLCEDIYPLPIIHQLIHSNERFDLVMTEIFAADCFVPFAHQFNAPLVSFMTSSVIPCAADRVGLPDNPSYIPNYFVDLTLDMNIYQRLYNSAVLIFAKLVHQYYTLPRTHTLVSKYFGSSIPSIDKIIRNTSLVFVNGDTSMSMSRPFPPNVVEIGGIHIKDSSKALPKDLQVILDNSPQGVILMSFGSLVRVSSLPPHVIRMFMKVFSTIPQTVILKYETDLPEAPPNVVIRQWLPQREIIEHKNVKALLAHGGLASTIEAVHFGKPLIGVPFFVDQFMNIRALERRGAGVMLDLDKITEEDIRRAVNDVLNNDTYIENMRRLSRQFRDRPMTPLQTAVYWTEYVIRHQGAPHLRPASVTLPLYQYLLLDVIAFLLLTSLLFIYVLYKLFLQLVIVRHSSKKDD